MGAGSALAATASAAQARVGASHSRAGIVVGAPASITAGQRLGNDPPRAQIEVATGVAAEDGALESGKLYVSGSQTANNHMPRITDTDGLSAYDTIAAGIKPGGRVRGRWALQIASPCLSSATSCLSDSSRMST